MTTLELAVSSCPNDTFAFYCLLHEPQEFSFHTSLIDIEELNRGMLEGRFDVVKASFTMGALLSERYELLDSGAALGFGVGPIVIYRNEEPVQESNTPLRVALPGEHTTAHFLWDYYLSVSKKFSGREIIKIQMNFAQIMEALQKGEADLGVVIHEGRFVYEKQGLSLFVDLGDFWGQTGGLPVPLGGIFVKKDLAPEIKAELGQSLARSILKARKEWSQKSDYYREKILPFIKKYAAELDEEVIENHIGTYVNEETAALTEKGRKAIDIFYENFRKLRQS